MPCSESAPFTDGTYRYYNVTLSGERFTYALAGRFEIQRGNVALLLDSTGLLSQHLAPGPLTPAKRYFLRSLASGSYREVVAEQPGVTYLPRYAAPV